MKSKEDYEGSASFKSLNAIRGEVREARFLYEAQSSEGKPLYLMPYAIKDSSIVAGLEGKQIFTTDTINEPDCLRFCPSNSSDKVEISLSGKYLAIPVIRLLRPLREAD